MFATTVPLLTLLSGQPADHSPEFRERMNHTEVVDGDDEFQLIAYDDSGTIIGSIAIWVEPDGATWAISDYADGFARVMVHPGGDVRIDGTLAPQLVADRANIIVSYLDSSEPAEAKWLKCAALTGIMVGTCAHGNLIACPFSAIVAACECLPKLEPKWKDKSCT